MDVVSGGELDRAWYAGAPTKEMVFAGVGKTDEEIKSALDGRFHGLQGVPDLAVAIPKSGVRSASSTPSRPRSWSASPIGAGARRHARVCLRVNPDVDPHTHEYTTTGKEENKFGIDAPFIPDIFDALDGQGVALIGLHVHIGSPVPQVEPYAESSRFCCVWSTKSRVGATRSRSWTSGAAGRSTTPRTRCRRWRTTPQGSSRCSRTGSPTVCRFSWSRDGRSWPTRVSW